MDYTAFLARNSVIGVSLLSIFYGVYVVLAGVAIHVLYRSRRKGGRIAGTKRISLSAAVLLFAMATAQVALYIADISCSVMDDLASDSGSVCPDILESVFPGMFIFDAQLMVADGLLAWRCFILFHRNKKLLAFLLILLAFETLPIIFVFLIPMDAYVYYYPVTLLTNLLLSGLLAGRILWHRRNMRMLSGQARFGRLASLIIECGVPYWIISLILVVTVYTGNVNSNAVQASAGLVTSIFPTLFIVLVELGMTEEQSTTIAAASAATHSIVFTSPTGTMQPGDEALRSTLLRSPV
ncbi:hypothetical protein OE88DRAFT_949152 [Heliocybe sulcata]|uniref:Uncharacterized protein n=1 Tax=Heliocybe sulcata TaxID=5364 RepID=A0A5C3NBJ3_9AGAM|nr:hypothetical protein OE88DRAFT_949152 [Heliocybe sulcata]